VNYKKTHLAGGHAAVDDDENQWQNDDDNDHSPQPWTLVSRINHRLNKTTLKPTTNQQSELL